MVGPARGVLAGTSPFGAMATDPGRGAGDSDRPAREGAMTRRGMLASLAAALLVGCAHSPGGPSVEEAIGGSLDGTTIGDLVRSPGKAYEDTKTGRLE